MSWKHTKNISISEDGLSIIETTLADGKTAELFSQEFVLPKVTSKNPIEIAQQIGAALTAAQGRVKSEFWLKFKEIDDDPKTRCELRNDVIEVLHQEDE
jgi:hypothetical protein